MVNSRSPEQEFSTMTDTHYNPATATTADLAAVMGRVDRYLHRHGAASGESPIPADRYDDVRQSILTDWLADDWTARDLASLARTGGTLFPATLSPLGMHLRAVLFHCGRHRAANWRTTGDRESHRASKRQTVTQTDPDGFSGTSMSSRAPDPARLAAAAEEASGVLLLSPAAAKRRSRKGLPLTYRGRLSAVPYDAPDAYRSMRRRSTRGYIIEVIARHPDRTTISIERWTAHRFETVGKVARRSPARQKTRTALPKGTTAADVRRALGMD